MAKPYLTLPRNHRPVGRPRRNTPSLAPIIPGTAALEPGTAVRVQGIPGRIRRVFFSIDHQPTDDPKSRPVKIPLHNPMYWVELDSGYSPQRLAIKMGIVLPPKHAPWLKLFADEFELRSEW